MANPTAISELDGTKKYYLSEFLSGKFIFLAGEHGCATTCVDIRIWQGKSTNQAFFGLKVSEVH
jgi:hypothetical protein